MSNIQDDSRFQTWKAQLVEHAEGMRTAALRIKEGLEIKISNLRREIDFIDRSTTEIDVMMAEVNKVMDMREWIKIKSDCAIKLMRLGQGAEELMLDLVESHRKYNPAEEKCTKIKKRTSKRV